MALQLAISKSAWEEIDAQARKVTALKEQLASRSVRLSQPSAKHAELTNILIIVKLQCAAEDTVSADLKSVAVSCGRPAKRAKIMHRCKDGTAAPFVAAFLALFAEWDDFKICFYLLTLKNQCIYGSATETEEFCEKSAKRMKIVAAAKSTPKCWAKMRYCSQ